MGMGGARGNHETCKSLTSVYVNFSMISNQSCRFFFRNHTKRTKTQTGLKKRKMHLLGLVRPSFPFFLRFAPQFGGKTKRSGNAVNKIAGFCFDFGPILLVVFFRGTKSI